jgi:hypothetical protein
MPDGATPTYQPRVARQADVQVIEQCFDGAKVEDANTTPILFEHPREDRQYGGLRLSSGSRSNNKSMITPQHHRDDLLLKGLKLTPTETVYDVMLQAGMEKIEGIHRVRPHVSAMSSTLIAEAAWRSVAVSSASVMVSL